MNWLDKEILGLRHQDKIGAPIYYQLVVQPPYGRPWAPDPRPQVPGSFPGPEPLCPMIPDDPNRDKKDEKWVWRTEPSKVKVGPIPFRITWPDFDKRKSGGEEPSPNLYVRQQGYAGPNPPEKTDPDDEKPKVPVVPKDIPLREPYDDPKPTPVPEGGVGPKPAPKGKAQQ